MFINWYYIKEFLFTFSKLQAFCLYLIYFFELLDVEHISPIAHKNVKCNSLGLALAIVPPPQGGIPYTIISRDDII